MNSALGCLSLSNVLCRNCTLRPCHITLCSCGLQLFLCLLMCFPVPNLLCNVLLVSCLLLGVTALARPRRPAARRFPCQDFADPQALLKQHAATRHPSKHVCCHAFVLLAATMVYATFSLQLWLYIAARLHQVYHAGRECDRIASLLGPLCSTDTLMWSGTCRVFAG